MVIPLKINEKKIFEHIFVESEKSWYNVSKVQIMECFHECRTEGFFFNTVIMAADRNKHAQE